MKKLTKSTWAAILLFGFVGQIAWAVENMEFNVFLFNSVGGTTKDIADMVAWSAGISTLTTLILGILSDRVGQRRRYLAVGYIFWGILTAAFAFISRANTAKLWPALSSAEVLSRTVFIVILMDCLMSFFGSMANDASFNAWVTEMTDSVSRPRVEGVLNIFPLLAMLVVAGGSGMLVEKWGWSAFFLIIGAVVAASGVIGLWIVKEPAHVQGEKMNPLQEIFYGFRPSVIRANRSFYLTLLSLCIFNISVQIFMPYLLIYLEKTLQFSTLTYSVVMAVVIVLASVCSVIIGRIAGGTDQKKLLRFSIIFYAVGLLLASLLRTPGLFILAGTVMMSGYVSILVLLMSRLRDETPLAHVGMFQGIRLLAAVFIPMLAGPYAGNFIIENSAAGTYVNSYGETVLLPVAGLFVAAALIGLLVFWPESLHDKMKNISISAEQNKNLSKNEETSVDSFPNPALNSQSESEEEKSNPPEAFAESPQPVKEDTTKAGEDGLGASEPKEQ